MDRTYKYKNGTIYVTLPKSCDREALKKVTEEFLKKVISEGKKNGYSNTSGNFREK
jgi:hypothetical protein